MTRLARIFALLALLLPLTAACGAAVEHTAPATDAGKSDAVSSPVCEGTNPGCCGLDSDGCSGNVGEASCLSGAWICPAGDSVGPACPGVCVRTIDSGPPVEAGGCVTPVVNAPCVVSDVVCPGPPPMIMDCPGCCSGCGVGVTQCYEEKGWSCGGPGTGWEFSGLIVCLPEDAGAPSDAASGSFACGAASCDVATEYCSVTEGGVALPDGGSDVSQSCQPIPAECANNAAGPSATCACLQTHLDAQCAVSNGSDLTVTVAAP